MISILSLGRKIALALTLAILPAQAWSEPLRLVALGDSLTQGYGLPEGEGLVPQLSAWLTAQGREVAIQNAGVSGDTTAGGLSRLDWTLAEPADAMMVMLGGNDMLRGIDPAFTRSNLEGILQKARDKGVPVLLVAMAAPANFGPDYQAQFDAIYPELAAQYQVLLAPDYIAPLLEGQSDAAAMQTFMQADGIHPNREGIARILPVLGPHVIALLDSVALR